jgi:hypothetical protein
VKKLSASWQFQRIVRFRTFVRHSGAGGLARRSDGDRRQNSATFSDHSTSGWCRSSFAPARVSAESTTSASPIAHSPPPKSSSSTTSAPPPSAKTEPPPTRDPQPLASSARNFLALHEAPCGRATKPYPPSPTSKIRDAQPPEIRALRQPPRLQNSCTQFPKSVRLPCVMHTQL